MQYRLRFLTVLGGLLLVLLVSAWLYQAGMTWLEGEARDFWSALEFASETITTTGYGRDANWTHPAMVIFVIALQIFGVLLVYMVVPLFLIPALEERFESRLPRHDKKLKDHVVVVRDGPAMRTTFEILNQATIPTVILETNADRARELHDEKRRVIYAPRISEGLEGARLLAARALITNDSDEANVNTILTARQLGYEGEILALAAEPQHRQTMRIAGADHVYAPRITVAAMLADRTSHKLLPRVAGLEPLGDHLRLLEIRIDASSKLAGRTLAEARIGEQTGTTIVGAWHRGRLVPLPAADWRIEARSILIAIGADEGLYALEATCGGASLDADGDIVVAGHGEVGREVVRLLRQADEPVTTIDRKPLDGVDVVGDILDESTYDQLARRQARAVVLALDNDSATLFATVTLRSRMPNVSIVARVNATDNVERIHRAGADFALSVSRVTGQMLAQCLLGREEVVVEPQLTVTSVPPGRLIGRHPSELDLRAKTGCSVVGVERDGAAIVRFADDFRFLPDDSVFICGSTEATARYRDALDRATGRTT